MLRCSIYRLLPLGLLVIYFTLCYIHLSQNGYLTCTTTPGSYKTQMEALDPANISVEEIYKYLRWTNSSSCILTQYFGGFILKIEPVVAYDGQKSVCLDAGVQPNPENCIVYSFGINNEWSFDDSVARYGCQVFAFDPTIKMKNHNRTAQIHFFDMGLLGSDEDRPDGKKYRTLSTIYEMLKPWHGNAVIDYLKVDIEGSEWSFIPQLIESKMLDRVKQIGIEIHMFNCRTEKEYRRKYEILKSLEDHGMVRFDSKGNPFSEEPVPFLPGGFGRIAYEIAWYNPKYYQNVIV